VACTKGKDTTTSSLDKGPTMSDHETPSNVLREEADSTVVGPGVVATKSQTQGGIIGTVAGTVVGALLGVIAGFLLWGGRTSAIVIAVIAFAVAGATAGGTMGGFLRNRESQQRGDADI
jgi:outer membrane lipoprotein SlyB